MRNPVGLLVVFVAFAAGLFYGLKNTDTQPPELKDATLLQPARQLAPFSLQSTRSTTIDANSLSDHWTLVFFGFTRCPDICPTTLQMLSQIRQNIADEIAADKLPDILLVSVDPERDTLAALSDYANYFGEGVYAARADGPALAEFTRDVGVVYQKIDLDDGDYTMDHTGAVLLIGPDATLQAVFTPPLRADVIQQDLLAILRYL
ncbi:MAG: SCO family protein [Pseudomonadota bacterium]